MKKEVKIAEVGALIVDGLNDIATLLINYGGDYSIILQDKKTGVKFEVKMIDDEKE